MALTKDALRLIYAMQEPPAPVLQITRIAYPPLAPNGSKRILYV